jgi:hypothetical protein
MPLARLTTRVSGLVGLATGNHAHRKATVQRWLLQLLPGWMIDMHLLPTMARVSANGEVRTVTIQPLPLLVILPQCRPNSEILGYIRAMAPFCGITTEAFTNPLSYF